ncbi:hypothetical protein BDP27DRAFT_1435868 [Rhodocollybia butyracea]|uniref:Uncharacterized protein n=1 Tax=Rhodocollybia butyracea TaxID=206335 RepID=A0A9P5P7F0_9AGAR|nr:hypothetical protein BDP27DRAFT_1435868 [Rhodocollybia butyracea]
MAVTLDAISIASIFTECILYGESGYFSVLFVIALYVLFNKRTKHQKLNKPMVAVSTGMFILATIHVGVDLRRLMEAFLYYTKGPAVQYLSEVDTVVYLIKTTAYCLQTLTGDGFVLYRLYLVWNGRKMVVLPICVCFAVSFGLVISGLRAFAIASPTAPVFTPHLQHGVVSFFALTLFINLSSSLLIAGRIWWIHQQTTGIMRSGRSLIPAAVVIIESGAIYSACLIILLTLYLSGSFAQSISLDAVPHVIGIVFSLIIVRVGLGLSTDHDGETKKITTLFANSSALTEPQNAEHNTPMQAIAIQIESATHSDSQETKFGGSRSAELVSRFCKEEEEV